MRAPCMHFKRTQNKDTNIFNLVTILAVVFSFFPQGTQSAYIMRFKANKIKDISCHNRSGNNDFPYADEKHFPFSNKSIFFLETSCKGGLDSRQACSIESAARAHTNWQINVLFAGPVTTRSQKSATISRLQRFTNINFYRIHLAEYSKDTPLEQLFASNVLSTSKWGVTHTADVSKVLTLYKFGGICLDLDMIVVKSLESLGANWVGKQDDDFVAAGALSISTDELGRTFSVEAVRELLTNLKLEPFANIGPLLVTRVLTKLCSTSDVTQMSAETCQGFNVYGPEYLYPIKWENWAEYFVPGSLNLTIAYTHHLWNFLSSETRVPKRSRLSKLARRFCPTIFRIFKITEW